MQMQAEVSRAPARGTPAAEREFGFSPRHFEAIRARLHVLTGIAIGDIKQDLVYGRLSRRLRQLGLTDFDAYLAWLETHAERETPEFINALTTNLTAFFREPHHFEDLRERVLPELLLRHRHQRRLRIWSAACSTGEEPYSLAITLSEALGSRLAEWDALVLATDIDTGVLATAARGIYPQERLKGLSEARRSRHFRDVTGGAGGGASVQATDSLRALVRFRQLNLNGPWPMCGRFDVVFCRNVVIYFDKPTQKTLFERIAHQMTPGGHLYIGHSESLFRVCDRFEHLGHTIHRLVGGQA
jgi:chemotaxis protein methyltransferase CheR